MYYHPLRLAAINAIEHAGLALKSLSEVIEFRRELVTDMPEGLQYVGLENISSNSGEFIETGEKQNISSAFRFHKGDVLFPKLRPYLNKVFLADFDGICSTEFHVLKVKECSAEYLFSFLTRSVVLEQTSRLMTGNTLPRLQTEDIEALLIPLPTIEKQNKIASGMKKLLEQAKQLRNKADELMATMRDKLTQMILA